MEGLQTSFWQLQLGVEQVQEIGQCMTIDSDLGFGL